MAVGDAFAPGGEIGLDADRRPAAVARDAQAGADVIDDQKRAMLVAERPRAGGVDRIGQHLVDEGVVLDRGREDGGQIVAGRRHGGLEAGDIVVVAEDLVRPIFRGHADAPRRAPGRGAVIGALGQDDGLLPRMGAGGDHGHGGGVRAVLAEDRPVGVLDQSREGLGELDHQGGGAGQGVADLHLAHEGRVDLRIAVAEQIGPIGAHEIEQLATVGVPEPRALAPGKELRIVVR